MTENGTDTQWYVVHTYSGYELKVERSLRQRVQTMDMEDEILEVFIPKEKEVELKEGRRTPKDKIIYPGYLLVKMKLSDKSWDVVRRTPFVTGFVGADSKPTPVEDTLVDQLKKQAEAEAPRIKVGFSKGQSVRITEGPFTDFIGVVDEVHTDKTKLKILVSFFGRETPVELDFLQVEKQ